MKRLKYLLIISAAFIAFIIFAFCFLKKNVYNTDFRFRKENYFYYNDTKYAFYGIINKNDLTDDLTKVGYIWGGPLSLNITPLYKVSNDDNAIILTDKFGLYIKSGYNYDDITNESEGLKVYSFYYDIDDWHRKEKELYSIEDNVLKTEIFEKCDLDIDPFEFTSNPSYGFKFITSIGITEDYDDLIYINDELYCIDDNMNIFKINDKYYNLFTNLDEQNLIKYYYINDVK